MVHQWYNTDINSVNEYGKVSFVFEYSVINVNSEVRSIIAITGLDKKIDISGQN